jgi:hypothetical protein
MNKPTVLSTGEWVLPITYSNEPVFRWNTTETPQLQGAAISRDQGKTWQLHGAIDAPHWALESMITELKDGRLWMLIRTGPVGQRNYLWESFSSDKGLTWTEGRQSNIENPRSRFFIRRLASGNLLMINHNQGWNRDNIRAQISTDDGLTWSSGLMLDTRFPSTYPDGIQDKDGNIWIVYDFDRRGDVHTTTQTFGQILMARFREEDALQGSNVSGTVLLRQVVSELPR